MISHNSVVLAVLLCVAGCTRYYESQEYTLEDSLPPQPTAAQLKQCPDGHKALKDISIAAGLLWMTPKLQRKIDNLEVWPVGCSPLGNYKTQVVCTQCRFAYQPVFGRWERRSEDPASFHRPLSPLIAKFPQFAATNYYQRIRNNELEGESLIYWTGSDYSTIKDEVLQFLASLQIATTSQSDSDSRYTDALKLRGRWHDRFVYVEVRRHGEMKETLVSVDVLDETAARAHDPLDFLR